MGCSSLVEYLLTMQKVSASIRPGRARRDSLTEALESLLVNVDTNELSGPRVWLAIKQHPMYLNRLSRAFSSPGHFLTGLQEIAKAFLRASAFLSTAHASGTKASGEHFSRGQKKPKAWSSKLSSLWHRMPLVLEGPGHELKLWRSVWLSNWSEAQLQNLCAFISMPEVLQLDREAQGPLP